MLGGLYDLISHNMTRTAASIVNTDIMQTVISPKTIPISGHGSVNTIVKKHNRTGLWGFRAQEKEPTYWKGNDERATWRPTSTPTEELREYNVTTFPET